MQFLILPRKYVFFIMFHDILKVEGHNALHAANCYIIYDYTEQVPVQRAACTMLVQGCNFYDTWNSEFVFD